ncbi:zinc finger MYND domain-containing protein 11-like isoform X2 [Portunus trituberculatus]|uniref:zinc finger MYND domain-containing protein 11-like isoform X2 n=1 Tax=Portunus trituberculatus TaxID=210409 RepID=UPI001E1CF0A7|nr:zinc finger MYND domain-containing protein 11-like isoform X2 [Portunus trituberculatus]XP_045110405.1 zinc finger MYND domain-containing protein 11-like isoform X2 [Portunus trituberculatus]
MKATLRRCSDPLHCQHLWDAIITIRNHKQLPSFDRIRRYMSRMHNMESDEVEKHLEECASDNLIAVTRKVGQKGSKVGIEQEGFRLPTPPEEPDRHDWYCFECHKGGEVVCCSKCYRVYHKMCINVEDQPYDNEPFVCVVCKKRLYQRSVKSRINREDLNMLLAFTVERLKERLPVNILERVIPAPSQKPGVFLSDRAATSHQSLIRADQMSRVSASEPWRSQLLLHHQMDLNTMEQKASDCRYKTLYDFEIDALTIVHNVVLYQGVHSTIADMARQMLRDCQYDLMELEQCKDCYRMSNEKSDKYWFCKPCRPPHQLVYAKQKGFPYWPAKVIKVENDLYDVRFFGSQHQRAVIEKSHIRPISVNIHTLQVKRTSAWNKACEELKKHQELLTAASSNETEQRNPLRPDSELRHRGDLMSPDQESRHSHRSQTHLLQASPKKEGREDEDRSSSDEEMHDADDNDDDEDNEGDDDEPGEDEDDNEDDEDDDDEEEEEEEEEEPEEEQASSISSTSKAKTPKVRKKEPPAPEDVVSSSSQELPTRSVGIQTSNRLMKMAVAEYGERSNKRTKDTEKAMRDLAEKLRREYEAEKQKVIQSTMKQMEKEVDRVKEEYRSKISEIEEKHKHVVSDTKKKQWCWTCEAEAIYHCCWNTAYCSIECQQVHWHKEHKKLCRRKR